MNKKQNAFHGSDVEKIEEIYGVPKDEIVSFGANVNPLGLSQSLKEKLQNHIDVITSYPDRDYKELREIIAAYCGVLPEYVVTGNGSTELISLLISQRKTKHALVLGPSYSEYERELSLAKAKTSVFLLKEENNFKVDMDDFVDALKDDVDFLILCNPNNPTSSAILNKDLKKILDVCKKRGIFVMIDETYVEFAPHVSEVTAMPFIGKYENLMVLRSVSKFYATPGLRFGYGVTGNKEFLSTLKAKQNPWSLNSVAEFAGKQMFTDNEYIGKTRALILTERSKMIDRLNTFRYVKVYDAYANFIFLRILKDGITSFDVFEHAIKKKMMIRDCSSFEGLDGEYIRFCIMSPEDNQKLLDCLEEILG